MKMGLDRDLLDAANISQLALRPEGSGRADRAGTALPQLSCHTGEGQCL
jgi:hypothetical protein